MASATSKFEQAGTKAAAAISSGKEAIQQSTQEVSRNVRDAIGDAVEQGKTSSRDFSRRIAGTAQEFAERGREGARYLGDYARNHALVTTLVGIGAGLILARLLARR